MKKYKVILWDLDGTLWDLHGNTQIALRQLFEKYKSSNFELATWEQFTSNYEIFNERVWALYREGKIAKEELRTKRFSDLFHSVNAKYSLEFVNQFADEFLYICPRLNSMLPGALDVLQMAQKDFVNVMVTNGFIEVQGIKMESAKIRSFFQHVVYSEEVGVRKPHQAIFDLALQKANANAEEAIMIGDDWEADILGARNAGIDQVFFEATEKRLDELTGRKGVRHNYSPTFTIATLNELNQILFQYGTERESN
jgi:putative hydrolase of the HAD superfamily